MSLTVTINSVDKSSDVVFPSLGIQDNINEQVDNCYFEIKKYGANIYVPEIGQEVVIARSGTTIFGGVIIKIQEKIKAGTVLTYKITCNDYSQYLKRQLVTERYTNQTSYYILNDIITDYTSGFTINNVSVSQNLSISFNRLTVAQCIEKLAETLNYVWYVDYDKDIHFFPKNTESAPFDITDTSGNYIYDSLEITEDLTQIKNFVLVQGGNQVSTETRTEYLSGDGVIDQFNLINKFSEVPEVIVGTTSQTVGIDYLDNDASYDVMWNYNEKYLRFTTGNIPPAGTRNISAEQTYEYPIVVKVPSPISIGEFGVYEFAITDKTITSQDQAIDRALAELKSYASTLNEGSFRTYENGLRSGQVININSTQRGKNIDVVIQTVETKMRDPEGNNFEYRVKFATLKSIGIIDYLQRQLRDKEIIEDDLETLLNYIIISDDTITTSDSLATPTSTTGPYTWDNFDWGYGVWG